MAEKTREKLYDLFGQNFLDGDKPVDWRASTLNATVVKEFIDEFVVPLIAQERKEDANDAWHDVNSKTPREGEFVLARLVWDSGKETYAVLEYKILDDNAPWVMDGSELSFWITVTHWRYFAKLQSNTKEKV